MKRHLFARIFLLYAAVVVLSSLFIEFYITDAVRGNYINNLRQNLTMEAALISHDVSFQTNHPLDSVCKQWKKETGYRVTIIALSGFVLGESDKDSELLNNHAGRPEIREALANGTGMSIRHSATLDHDLLYVAKKIMQGDRPAGFIRLSVPLSDVDAAVNSLRLRILAVIISILVATGLFSIGQMEQVRRLTQKIREFARALAAGAKGEKLFLDHGGEFEEIAESLNTMSLELQNSIAENEEEKKRLNVVLRSIPDVLMIIDSKGTIILTSSASRKVFGDVPLRGKQVIEVVRTPDFISLMESASGNLTTAVSELKLDYPEERYFSARISPLFYKERELSGFVILLHDITQLKKLEQTRKDFVANISHEIKTPITSIKGFADTLLDGALHDPEHAEKFVNIIKSNSERINSLVDDLMTISKIELGVAKIEKTAVNIVDACEQAVTILKAKAGEKNLYLKTDFPGDGVMIPADKDKLIQVLTNLLDNAIKFTEKGGVKIGARSESNKTIVYVEDTGVGIQEKHVPRLGERFYRVDTARSRKMGGTGLGLAIVKHLVKAHGWEMVIESVPEKGTKVSIICAREG